MILEQNKSKTNQNNKIDFIKKISCK
jgi:hypothetical protein